MSDQNLTTILICIGFLLGAIVLFFVLKSYKRKIHEIKTVELDPGSREMQVKIIAGFLGIKYLPTLLAVGINNLNPELEFFQDGIEYKVFSKKNKRYSDIETVDIFTTLGTKNLIFKFNNSIITFTGNLANEDNLRNALEFLKKKNCPMSSRAKKY